ncbi:type II secretion system protein [bacterium]|nr:type II secretion system protein [bacterium]
MMSNRADRAFTLLELMASIVIILILVATVYPALEKATPRAEKVACMSNLKNLRVLFDTYALEGWPQVPKETPLGSIAEQKWWLEKTKKDLGLSEKNWECPTLRRLFRSEPEAQRPLIHYLPTPFSNQPNKANQWPQMPWFIEIGNGHGCGNLIVRQNGTVEPAPR